MPIDTDYMIEPGLSPEMVEATARAQVADTIARHTSAKDAPFFFEAEGRQFVSVPAGWGAFGAHEVAVDVTLPAQPRAVTFRSTLRPEDLTATAPEAARAADEIIPSWMGTCRPDESVAIALANARRAMEGDHPEWTPGWRAHLKRGIEELAAALACAP